MTRAEIIRKYREDAGLTQTKLEELARLPKKSVHFYETGRREVPTQYLIRIADVLSIPKEELLVEQTEAKELSEEIAEDIRIAALKVLKKHKI